MRYSATKMMIAANSNDTSLIPVPYKKPLTLTDHRWSGEDVKKLSPKEGRKGVEKKMAAQRPREGRGLNPGPTVCKARVSSSTQLCLF